MVLADVSVPLGGGGVGGDGEVWSWWLGSGRRGWGRWMLLRVALVGMAVTGGREEGGGARMAEGLRDAPLRC